MKQYQAPITLTEPLISLHLLSTSMRISDNGDEQWKARAPQKPF